jgi:Na+-transporting NADH:ubiquinone oxidoreductase subunit A
MKEYLMLESFTWHRFSGCPNVYKTIVGSSIKYILSEAGLKKTTIESSVVLFFLAAKFQLTVGFSDSQITVIRKEYEFMGWLAQALINLAYPYFFLLVDSNKKHNLNLIYGEERPFVMTGQYEKFFHGYLSRSTFKS